ncbi:hypothetical protein OG625_05830 [Streptomyces sp. NBC_01351]|uniref:hypothetical protein n=1 Tax=Streptomyces sp. NBC_01351 TaxID=2903833 RepID=UPI002E3686E9|nr:hypothetical protein [Streptomyces sp. NBC_01351]
MQPHFHFGLHAEHGVVARPTTAITSHLAAWYLEREQFEPAPGRADLFRLTQPDHDLRRRARQTVHDLRRHGFTVHADLSLDPAETAPANAPVRANSASERLARIARAAAAQPPQHRVNTPQVASAPVPTLGAHSSAARRTR